MYKKSLVAGSLLLLSFTTGCATMFSTKYGFVPEDELIPRVNNALAEGKTTHACDLARYSLTFPDTSHQKAENSVILLKLFNNGTCAKKSGYSWYMQNPNAKNSTGRDAAFSEPMNADYKYQLVTRTDMLRKDFRKGLGLHR